MPPATTWATTPSTSCCRCDCRALRDLEPQLARPPVFRARQNHGERYAREHGQFNAVPDDATIYIDRRVTFGDTHESAMAEVQALIDASGAPRRNLTLEMLLYDEPSYTGFVLPVDKYFPAWALDETHPLVQAALATTERAFGAARGAPASGISAPTAPIGPARRASRRLGLGRATSATRTPSSIKCRSTMS